MFSKTPWQRIRAAAERVSPFEYEAIHGPFRASPFLHLLDNINRFFKRLPLTKKEALIKSLIWRVAMVLQGLVVAYCFVGDFSTALGITIVMNILATLFYYLFDLLWFNRVSPRFFRARGPP